MIKFCLKNKFCLFVFIFNFLLINNVWASAPDNARVELEKSIVILMDLIKKPEYSNPSTKDSIVKKIEVEVHKIFNFQQFASRTVGVNWRGFTDKQKQDFSAAFADLLFVTYLDKVDGYNGEQVRYTGQISNSKGNMTEIQTQLTLKNGTIIPVAYRMLLENGKWSIYDVITEGISLVKNYRSQFGSILTRNSPEELIQQVEEKTLELKQKSD